MTPALRPPVLDEATLTPEQRAVHDAILQGPRGVVEGPLRVWLHSPGLAERAQALGAYCRYGTSLPTRLSELAILVVGAHWQSGFEWHAHAPIALAAGVAPETIAAIKAGQTPQFPDDAARVVHGFACELMRARRVSDTTFAGAVRHLRQQGVADLVGILGYYTLISMTINAFHVPVPPGAAEPFAPA